VTFYEEVGDAGTCGGADLEAGRNIRGVVSFA
jgi:hypothetical protein